MRFYQNVVDQLKQHGCDLQEIEIQLEIDFLEVNNNLPHRYPQT